MNVHQDRTIVIQTLTAITSKDHITVLAKKDIEEMVLTAKVHTLETICINFIG